MTKIVQEIPSRRRVARTTGIAICIAVAAVLCPVFAEDAPPASNAQASAPTIHYAPKSGALGDIIPYFHDGVYHMFYLKGSKWGHISSHTLTSWTELPDALDKSPGETDPDGECCWTGSIVEHCGEFHLFYTGKNSRDPKGDQKVMHATSPDLVTWTKRFDDTFYADGSVYWSKPVNGAIDDKQIYHHQAFRDPEVFWNAKDKVWWLLLHAMLADGSSPAFARYTSSDLKTWAPAKPLVVFSKTSSGDCPNIFPLNDRWYLLSAEHHYTSAPSVEGPYPTEMATYDCGELFVPKALYDGKRRIIAGWIGDHEGHRDNGKGVWGGVMSMPREIYADNQGQLRQRPLHEIIEAFGRVVPGTPTEPKSGVAVPAPGNFMLHCTVTAQTSAAKLVIAMRQAAADASSGYRLTLDFSAKQIALSDATRNYSQPCAIDKGAPVDVRIFAEGSVLECFINDAYCFTMRAFDRADGAASFVYSDAEMLVRDLSVKALVEGTK